MLMVVHAFLTIRRKHHFTNPHSAETFMEGLRAQAERLSKGLRDNEQVFMYCCHGIEKLQVLEISMPSSNVVSMCCLDAEKRSTYVTGHMHAITFSFVIETIVPPAERTPIGFNMPQS
jgi:hypothetical protein